MFIKNPHGKESIAVLAAQLGCEIGEATKGVGGYGRPGIVGNTFGIKDQLKAAGARWDGANKAWTFDSWAALESAIGAAINK
jgi:hypothetical protein